MKKIVYTFIILYFLVIVNILFFIFNKDYNFFIKTIKYGDDYERLSNINVSDDYIIRDNLECNIDCDCDEYLIDKKYEELKNKQDEIDLIENTKKEIDKIPKTPDDIDIIDEIIEEKEIDKFKEGLENYSNILLEFESYDLGEPFYEEFYEIFGLTYEYPNEYITFSGGDLEIYLFKNSDFRELSNFFEILKYIGYTINYVDIFGENSFFINLDEPDGNVRLVIESNGSVFGIMLTIDEYNNLRSTFENF